MSEPVLVLDTIPENFGLQAGDWAGLFLSRTVAQPLVEKIDGIYSLKLLEGLESTGECSWRLVLRDSPIYNSRNLVKSWMTYLNEGDGRALNFIRHICVRDARTIELTCKRPYKSILPLLDSPWLWAGMDYASNLKIIGDSVRKLILSSEDIGWRIPLVEWTLATDLGAHQHSPGKCIAAALPMPPAGRSVLRPLNIYFTLVPGSATTSYGPFTRPGSLDRVRSEIAASGLLDTSDFTVTTGRTRVAKYENRQFISKISYTPFFPNERVANIVADLFNLSGPTTVCTEQVTFDDHYRGYSQDGLGAEIVPLVPINGACTSLLRDLVSFVARFLDPHTMQSVMQRIDDMEQDLANSDNDQLCSSILEEIAAMTGYGVLGKYKGHYQFNGVANLSISEMGFLPLEGTEF